MWKWICWIVIFLISLDEFRSYRIFNFKLNCISELNKRIRTYEFDNIVLPDRLQQVLDFATSTPTFQDHLKNPLQNLSIADIGADHGYVACSLAQSPIFSQVYAIDCSPTALENTRATVERSIYSSKIEIMEGNGVLPLLARNLTCDALIMSGMGANTIFSILTNGTYTSKNLDDVERITFKLRSLKMIDQLRVKMIIVQLWPPDLLKLLELYHFLIFSCSFDHLQQSIHQKQKFTHITSLFIRRTVSNNVTPFPLERILLDFPFRRRKFAKDLHDNEEKAKWLSYLTQQRKDLELRFNRCKMEKELIMMKPILSTLNQMITEIN